MKSSFKRNDIFCCTSFLNDLLRGISFAVKPACYPCTQPLLYVSVRGSVLLRLTLSITRPPGSQLGSDDTAAEMSKAIRILVNPPLYILCCVGVCFKHIHVCIYIYTVHILCIYYIHCISISI